MDTGKHKMNQASCFEILKLDFLILVSFCFLSTAERMKKSTVWIRECPPELKEDFGPKVFITISSLAYKVNRTYVAERYIELNWYNAKPQETDWIGLFKTDPSEAMTKPLQRAFVKTYTVGHLQTKVKFPYYSFTADCFTSEKCLNYWVAYVRGNETLASDCFKIYPTWMWDSKEYIGDLTLNQIMFPGTHNSGCYQRFHRRRSETILARFKYCQEEDIWQQLVYGIRHFDFRIGYYKQFRESFWINHDYFRCHPFSTTLSQIKEFIQSTNEILVLDFHRFPFGFREEPRHHAKFILRLLKELQQFMIPRSVGFKITLKQLWSKNQRILVAYNSMHYVSSEYLWEGLLQNWANTLSVDYLKTYLNIYMNYEPESELVWVSMAELTPTFDYIKKNRNEGLRVLADKVNRKVTLWTRVLWWNKSSAIATDFFLGNNLIAVAVEANKKRKLCKLYLASYNK